MTADQALDVLRRLGLGKHFTMETIREARLVSRAQPDSPPRGLNDVPGCTWQRPAPGWVDLRKRAA